MRVNYDLATLEILIEPATPQVSTLWCDRVAGTLVTLQLAPTILNRPSYCDQGYG